MPLVILIINDAVNMVQATVVYNNGNGPRYLVGKLYDIDRASSSKKQTYLLSYSVNQYVLFLAINRY